MAVIGAPFAHSKLELRETGCNDTSSLLSDPYAFNMSYQYAAPPTNQLDIDVPPPVYNSAFKLESQDSLALNGDCKESEGPYDEQKPGSSLRRSFSTPNAVQMRQVAQEAQSHAGAASEKKRNKLGYHRTSIACSHCRRRKIRCITSPEVQNRCVNCIRLKKECSFYPVDQQPGGESRSRAPVRQVAGSSSVTSTNSSPAVATGSPAEMTSHHGHGSASGISQGNKAQPVGEELYPSEVKGPGPTTATESVEGGSANKHGVVPSNGMATGQYSYNSQPSSNWVADGNSASLSKPENLNLSWTSYGAESPIGTHFSPYAHSSAASATWASRNSEAGSHDDMAWSDFPPPARSMSLSGESSGSHQQLQYLGVGPGQPFDRRQSTLSDMYAQSYGTPVAGMTPASVAGIEGSGSTVVTTLPSNAESWQQPILSQSQSSYGKPPAMFDGWQYDKASGGQHMWLEEQRPQSTTAAQASTDAYYSA